MNLTPAQAGQEYTTIPLSSSSLTVWINDQQVSATVDPVEGGYTYRIPAAAVQPPGPILFKNGSTVVATAIIKS